MRILRSHSDFSTYEKIFLHLKIQGSTLVLWQLLEDGSRIISQSLLDSYKESILRMTLKTQTEFLPELPMFCYAEDRQLIFKTSVNELSSLSASLFLPSEMKVLEDAETIIIRGQLGAHPSD